MLQADAFHWERKGRGCCAKGVLLRYHSQSTALLDSGTRVAGMCSQSHRFPRLEVGCWLLALLGWAATRAGACLLHAACIPFQACLSCPAASLALAWHLLSTSLTLPSFWHAEVCRAVNDGSACCRSRPAFVGHV